MSYWCPECSSDTRVLDSRWAINREHVRRIRKCRQCGLRFSTFEITKAQKEKLESHPATLTAELSLLLNDFKRKIQKLGLKH